MSVLFIVTLLLLAAVAYRIYRRQQELNSHRAARQLRPAAPRSLFDQTPEGEEAGQQSAPDDEMGGR